VSQDATEWGGPLDETGKPQVWHDKGPSLLKGPERREYVEMLQPFTANGLSEIFLSGM
jgi:hypothetical protein